jgi:hypothetical protein
MFDYIAIQSVTQIIAVVIITTIAIKYRFRIQFRKDKNGFVFDASPADSEGLNEGGNRDVLPRETPHVPNQAVAAEAIGAAVGDDPGSRPAGLLCPCPHGNSSR